MQSVIDKLRAKQSASENKWLTRHQSTQDLLERAQRENKEMPVVEEARDVSQNPERA